MCLPAVGALVVGKTAAATMTAAQLAMVGGIVGSSLVATGVSAYGSIQQGRYSSKVAKNNAIVADHMAKDARSRGARDEMTQRLKSAQLKSSQRAALGASGRDVSSGSASDLLADTAMIGELDALTIRSNAEREAYSAEVSGTNALAQGKLDRMRGNYGAASTLLAGGAKVHGRWGKAKGE